MRTSILLTLAVCLGVATASPATELLKALKRQYIAVEPEILPESPEGDKVAIFPSDEEFLALKAMGAAIDHLAKLAEQSPKDLIDFVASIGDTIPEDNDSGFDAAGNPVAVPYGMEKRGRGGRGGRGGRQGGRGRKGGRGGQGGRGEKSGEMKQQFMKQIMKQGVYKTVVEHVGIMGTMLTHSKAILEHMIKGPDCENCPDLPEEVMEILLGEDEDSEESGSREEPFYATKGKRPAGRRPTGNGDDQDSAFGRIPDAKYPTKGRRPAGRRPTGNGDDQDSAFGRIPDAKYPTMGQRPSGQRPNGDVDETDSAFGRIPEAKYPTMGQRPAGQRPKGDVDETDSAFGRIPEAKYPIMGQRPAGQLPKGDFDDVDSAFGQPAERALAKRLLKLLKN